jgi:short-subunit dehydrogenase
VKDQNHFYHRYGPWGLVAGASRGLGAEYAAQLAAKGLNLFLVARNEEALRVLAAQISTQTGVQVVPLALDLACEDSPAKIAEQTAGLEIGLLVYNAAHSVIGPFFEIPLEDHLREMATNMRTSLILAYQMGRRMLPRKRGGIILMSSLSATQGSAFISNYAATKAYNQVLGEGLWEELRAQGIDVLVSCPGPVSTPNYQNSLENGSKAPVSAMSPRAVVAETLESLGKRPYIIPGHGNRLAAFFMQRLISRPVAIRLMGRVLRGMYT